MLSHNRIVVLAFCLIPLGCLSRGQRYSDLTTRTPLAKTDSLIIGFLGGRDSWNDPGPGVRRFASRLEDKNLPGVHIETIENKKRSLALELIQRAFDFNQNGEMDTNEKDSAHIILYGQSFGGAAVVRLARELEMLRIPVLLTVQIDSVGRNDALIPSNVRNAANFYQNNGIFIRGEPKIRAADATKTAIIGNFKFDYSNREIDISNVPWYKRIFRVAHTKMDRDPEVWAKVEDLILTTLTIVEE